MKCLPGKREDWKLDPHRPHPHRWRCVCTASTEGGWENIAWSAILANFYIWWETLPQKKRYPILICCLSACTDAHNTNIFTHTHTMYEQSTLEQGYTMTNLIPLTTLYLLGNTDFSVNLKQYPTCKTIPILETNLDLLICCKWERKCTWMKIILAVIICKGLSSEL